MLWNNHNHSMLSQLSGNIIGKIMKSFKRKKTILSETMPLHAEGQRLRHCNGILLHRRFVDSVGDFGRRPITKHRPANNVFDWKRTPVNKVQVTCHDKFSQYRCIINQYCVIWMLEESRPVQQQIFEIYFISKF